MLGQKTEGLISSPTRNLLTDKEGTPTTLPFFQSLDALSHYIRFDKKTKKALEGLIGFDRMRVPLFYLNLMERDNPGCPIRGQAVPSIEELGGGGQKDPLAEQLYSVTPALLKRHPNRAVFLVSSECAMYCRFCNRKRLAGKGWEPEIYRKDSLRYIERDPDIDEIILSGGDPFMLTPKEIGFILSELRRMKKIKTIRISTRVPVVFPEGFTKSHLREIEKHSPLWIVIHINHPREVSPEFLEIVKKIRETGNMLISQTVLLRNINDCPYVLLKLFNMLIASGVKPYYLFQLDEVLGTSHFKVQLGKGIEIMRTLRRLGSGLAMPQYALDIPGGLGKIPVDHVYVRGPTRKKVPVESTTGHIGTYLNDGIKSTCMNCGICGKKD